MRRILLVGLSSIVISAQAAAQPAGQAAASAPSAAFTQYEGRYRLASGDHVFIGRVGVVDEVARQCFADWQTGRYGYLTAEGTDRFVARASTSADAPVQTEIVFTRDGAGGVNGLTIRESGSDARSATRALLYTDRDVTFRNGDVVLSGTLRTPASREPHPGIVLVHGSGPGTRTQVSFMSSFFASLGLAVLSYDKRGCGASGGDWKKVDLDVLAGDALAGVRWLRSQSVIDAKRVGLWGFSQGGWIVPLAASLGDEVAFAINGSGPATTLRRQDTFLMANTLRADGLPEADIAAVIEGLNVLYDFGRGKASAEALDAVMEKARSHPNPRIKAMALPPAKDVSAETLYANQRLGDAAWFYHLNPDNDAVAPYRRARCPLLVVYGKLDYVVPVDESVAIIRRVIDENRRSNLSIEIIPDTGHGYVRMQEGRPMDAVQPMGISRTFFDTIERWLRANRIVAPAR